jgi:hypothetical protein
MSLCYMSPMKIIISFILLFSISWTSSAGIMPIESLLTYFAANCKGQGEFTRAAVADATALIETLRSIQNDNDCKTVSGAVAQLGLLNSQLNRLENTNETQVKIAEYNAKEQELLIQISKTSDPATISSINQVMRDLQLQRASLYSREKNQSEMNLMNKGQILGEVIQIANTAFNQINSNQLCLKKHPNILNTATTMVASIGATAAVVNPALGLGLSAGATALGQTVEGVRRYYSSRELRRIADSTLSLEAYRCALEVMSERWCQMREAERFINFKDNRTVLNNLKLEHALRLSDREIPVIMEWLNKIRNGVTPTSTADASRQNSVREREGYIQIMEASGLGQIEETRQVHDQETDSNDRWNIIKSLVKSLVPNVAEKWRNPLHDAVGSRDYAFFFLLGLPDDSTIRNAQTGSYYTLDTWPRPEGFNVSLDTVKRKFEEWIEKARKRVNQELSTVLQPDPLQTLTSAYDKTGNRWKIEPIKAFEVIITFLKANPPMKNEVPFRKLHVDTIKRLEEIHATTQAAVVIANFADNSSIENIYSIAQLRYGTVVIEARLEMMVRLAVLEYIENSSPEDQAIVAQLLAAERFTESVTSATGKDSIDTLRDIQNAKPLTISNLNSFMSIFGNNLNRALSRLKSEEEANRGTLASELRNKRTQLCFHLLSVPNVEKFIQSDFCQGLQLKAYQAGGPDSIVIGKDTFIRDFDERACIHREYIQQSKIYKTWGIKLVK